MEALGKQIPIEGGLGQLAADEDRPDGIEPGQVVVVHRDIAERHLDPLGLKRRQPLFGEGGQAGQIPVPVQGLASGIGQRGGELCPVGMVQQAEGQLKPFRFLDKKVVEQGPDLIGRTVRGGGGAWARAGCRV